MNIYQLKYFLMVAKEENISRAAEKVNLSQQALSSVISTLEKHLDTKLFDRMGRKIMLNENGKILLESAEVMVQEYDSLMEKLRWEEKNKVKTLRVGSTSTQAIRKLLMSFMKDNPDVKVTNFYITANLLQDTIKRNDVDLIVSSIPYSDAKTHCETMTIERLHLVVSKKHPLAKREGCYLSELKDCAFSLPLPNNAYRMTIQGICDKAGFQPYVILETDNEDQLALSVIHNLAVLLIPDVSTDLDYYTNDQVVQVPVLDDFAKRELYLIWRGDMKASEGRKRFYNFIVEKNNRVN